MYVLINVDVCLPYHNMPPRRRAATAVAPRATRSARGRATEPKDESESGGEEIGDVPSTTTNKRTSNARSSAKARNRSRETGSGQQTVDKSNESDGSAAPAEGDASEESESLPTKGSRRPRSVPGPKATRKPKQATASSKKSASFRRVETSSDDDGGAIFESDQPKATRRNSSVKEDSASLSGIRSHSPCQSGGRDHVADGSAEEDNGNVRDGRQTLQKDPSERVHDAASQAPPAQSSEDEEDLLPQVSLRASAAPPSRVGRTSVPPSRAARSSIGPSILTPKEIETGPKSRLVIHKMALVNFKSYKGRQEIGPFHKVCREGRVLRIA